MLASHTIVYRLSTLYGVHKIFHVIGLYIYTDAYGKNRLECTLALKERSARALARELLEKNLVVQHAYSLYKVLHLLAGTECTVNRVMCT